MKYTHRLIMVLFYAMSVAFMLLLCFKKCSGPATPNAGSTTLVRVVIHDTITHTLPPAVHVSQHFIHTHDTLYKTYTIAQLDTLAAHYYNTTIDTRLYTDTNISATITDTIAENSLNGRCITYKVLRPQNVYNYTTVTRPKTYWAAGFIGNIVVGGHPDILIMGWVSTPRKLVWNIGYMPVGGSWVVGAGVRF